MPILLLLAHPALHRSRANVALVNALEGLGGVTVHDLYETYPDYFIDVEREQKLVSACSALVLQHPFYWYSTPGLLKEWIDLVLTHGFAYGAKGQALRGKPWLNAITAGGREEVYGVEGFNRFTVAELLRPIEATAHLCGGLWQEPFVLHGGHAMDEGALAAQARTYRDRIEGLLSTLRAEDS